MGNIVSPQEVIAQSGADPISGLRRVYGGILLFKQFRSACDQLAPENTALHKTAYDTFAQKHSVARIEQFFAATPNPVPKLDGVKSGIEKVAPKILAQVVARPDTCAVLGPLYEQMVANQMGAQGVTNLGTHFDSLLAQANLVPAAPPLVPDATTQAPAVTAPQPQANRAAPAAGKSNKQIAADLGISRRTVESHHESLMRKVEIRTVAGLTRFALDAGLLDDA